MDDILLFKIFGFVILIFSIVVHEISHGLGALLCGDDTAYRRGRLTLNPIKHVDMLGSIILPIICVLLPGGILFGWAKPVPVDISRMKNPRKGLFISVFAGPASNLLLALLGGLLFRGIPQFFPHNQAFLESFYSPTSGIGAILLVIVITNLSLALFNLIPVPPLDGSKILYSLLPPEKAHKFADVYERYGLFIIIFVIFYAGSFLGPVINSLARIFLGL